MVKKEQNQVTRPKSNEERTELRRRSKGSKKKLIKGEGLRAAKKRTNQGKRFRSSEERPEPRKKGEG